MQEGSTNQRMWTTSRNWKTQRAFLLPQLKEYLGRKASRSSTMELQTPSFLDTAAYDE